MIKLAAISPKTMVAGEQQGANSPEEMELKNLFSQLSYTMLEGKAPNTLPYVTSFKVLEVDMGANRAVGAFELDINGNKALIPVVMSDGKVKSPEVVYSGKAKSFIPLSDKWIEEIQKPEIEYLGKSEKAPDTLSSDLDVRAATLPPTTGRFVYASARRLPDILDAAHPNTKLAFAKVLQQNKNLLKMAMEIHGSDLLEALKSMPPVEKIAQTRVWVLTPQDSREKFAEAFGGAAREAYQLARNQGYVTRDLRTRVKVAVEEQSGLNIVPGASSGLTEPKFPGIYHVVGTNNKTHKVIIIPRPFECHSFQSGEKHKYLSHTEDDCYLVITPSNRHIVVHDKLLAIPDVDTLPASGAFFNSVMSAKDPKNGHNLFVGLSGTGAANAVVLEEPLSEVSETGEGYTAKSGPYNVVITTARAVKVPHRVNMTIYIPSSYRPIKSPKAASLKNLMSDVGQVSEAVTSNLADIAEGQTLKVSHTLGGYWAVNGKQAETIVDAMLKVASAGVHLDSINPTLRAMERGETKNFHLISPTRLSKVASIFGPGGEMPPPPMPMDPNAPPAPPGQPMGPGMGGAPPAPPTTMPTETVNTMEAAAQTGDPSLFDSAAVGALVQSNPLNEAIAPELPTVEKAIDSVAKILVSLQLREADLSRQMGSDDFFTLESNLRKVLGGLGEIVLSVHSQKRMNALPEGM